MLRLPILIIVRAWSKNMRFWNTFNVVIGIVLYDLPVFIEPQTVTDISAKIQHKLQYILLHS